MITFNLTANLKKIQNQCQNCQVLANLYSCHMDPTVWKEPEKFDISRFLDETKTKVINRDQVVSFSFGQNFCNDLV